jgi:D-alanine--poly(phosphoribitol) ligase subunit 1
MQNNVLKYFEETSRCLSGKIAISDKTRKLSFRELRQAGLSLAQSILENSNYTCHPIAVYLPKSIEAVASLLGILYSGNFYVPLDAKAPVERLRSILDNLSPICVITNQKLLPTLLAAGFDETKVILLEDATSLDSPSEAEALAKRWHGLIDTDPIYVIYTSGSTGAPKGVAIPHRGVIDYIDWANSVYDISENDIIGSQAPFFFDNSTLDIYLCFSRGATLHLIPEDLFAFPVKLVEHLRDFGVTLIFWVPSLMTTIANFDILASVKPRSLDKVLFAGEVMPARTLNYWRRHLPSALFSNLYGPTEITVDCTYYVFDRPIADHESVPIGFPCRNSDVLILNDQDKLAADGEIGELCVRGSSLALGYWNAPDKTAAAFVQNPLRPQYPERIYRTGDLVQRNSHGEILFLGRKDSQIKHQGYRIELGEIEAAASSLKGVRTACVLYNQPKQEITLFYEANTELSTRDLREKMARSLPRYMLPAVFKWLPAMPMNANGKTDRPLLANTHFQS